MDKLCHRFFVSGRVQGVFYRQFTVQQAKLLQLCGWARNLHDGRVEILACGDAKKLQQLEKWLWQGPTHAQVQAVEINTAATDPGLKDFQVRY